MIGVFDSGIGGLTVLSPLLEKLPNESFLYLGDTARVPYGNKSPQVIRKFSEQIIDLLVEKKVKAIVIACNSASAQVPETHWKGVPVYTVIHPGVVAAQKATVSKRIGVLGTKATVISGAYVREIRAQIPDAQVFVQPCPLFVPLAEEGWVNDPVTNLIAFRYIQPLMQNNIDTIILGCTHYPLLRNAIQRATGPDVKLVDSGEAIAETLKNEITNGKIKAAKGPSQIDVLMSDLSDAQKIWTETILAPIKIQSFQAITLG